MLSPKIHGLEQFRSLSRFTARHDWRKPEVGLVWSVGRSTFRLVAIQPNDPAHGRYQSLAVIQDLGSRHTFTRSLNRLWAEFDSSPAFRWAQGYIQKAIARNRKKALKRRMAIRRFLVQEGLVIA